MGALGSEDSVELETHSGKTDPEAEDIAGGDHGPLVGAELVMLEVTCVTEEQRPGHNGSDYACANRGHHCK